MKPAMRKGRQPPSAALRLLRPLRGTMLFQDGSPAELPSRREHGGHAPPGELIDTNPFHEGEYIMANEQTITLKIGGMSCGNCQKHVQEALVGTPGVRSAEVDLQGATATVTFDAATTTPEQLIAAVEAEGYTAQV